MQSQQLTCFRVVGNVMDAIIEKDGISLDKETCSNIREAIDHLSDYYLGERGEPCYENLFCRLAYLYAYAPLRANLVKHIFDEETDLKDYLNKVHEKKTTLIYAP